MSDAQFDAARAAAEAYGLSVAEVQMSLALALAIKERRAELTEDGQPACAVCLYEDAQPRKAVEDTAGHERFVHSQCWENAHELLGAPMVDDELEENPNG